MRILAVNLTLTLLLLVAIEGSVRLAHPEITPAGTDRKLLADSVFGAVPGPRPGSTGHSNGARFTADARGFWRYARQPDRTAPAWLFLGDSVTMGIGVHPDSTFAGRLAARSGYRVLNPSIVGHDVRDYHRIFDALTAPHTQEPRIERATVFWCLNDLYGAAPDLDDPNATVRTLGGPVLIFIRRHVHTYHWLKALLTDRPRVYYEHDRRLYDGPALAASADEMRRLHALADARGVRLDVVLLPYEYQLRHTGDDAFAPQQRLTAALDGALAVHDAAPFLHAHTNESADLYLYGDGIHFSQVGHELVATYVQKYVIGGTADHGRQAAGKSD